MGNSFPPLTTTRSVSTTTKSASNDSPLKKSRSVRDYKRSASLITSCITTQHHQDADHVQRRYPSFARPRSLAPTDAEVIDIQALRNENEHQLIQQLDYIHSCVRKDKGLFGMMTENLQNKHIFSNDEPENTHTLERTPDEYDMNYQSIYLQTPDGEFIHAYWIYQNDEVESPLTMLYLHGAGGNVSHRLEVLRMFYENLRCNILIIDYRGFGKSSGSPSERGLYIDAQTAYDYLIYKQNVCPDDLLVFGTSLGASVAIQLVSDPLNRAKVAIFENPFTSVPEVAKYYLTYAKSVIGITKSIGFIYLFDSLEKVRRIECPCVYLTGLLDPIIPTWMSNTLYNQTTLTKKRQLFEYPYGKHNDLPVMNDYFENLQSFISELSSSAEPSVLR